jgi:diguanylate cyclase (GGDEF)-like protein
MQLSAEFDVATAGSAAEARHVLSRQSIDIILTDQRMPGETGVQLLEWARANNPHVVGLLMTGYAELEDAVDAINRGNVYYYLLKPWRAEELFRILRNAAEHIQLQRSRDHLVEELRRVNMFLEERVDERTREVAETNHKLHQRSVELEEANKLLQHRNRELETLALTDPLTGLLNRRAIEDVARAELNRHTRYPASRLALGVIDADNFREINRRHLLPGGDQVLIGLARTLTSSIRAVDTVGRIGGEEFLVVAPETGLDGVGTLAERIRTAVEAAAIHYNGKRIDVTISAGFAVVESQVHTTFEQMQHVAAECLGEAKASGRNRCVVRAVADEPAERISDQPPIHPPMASPV